MGFGGEAKKTEWEEFLLNILEGNICVLFFVLHNFYSKGRTRNGHLV